MKKLFVSILALIYLSTSVGATIHYHYCMGKLISWGLVNHETRNCNYCGMPKTGGSQDNLNPQKHCCKDEQKLVKNDKDQKQPQTESPVIKFVPDPANQFQELAGLKIIPFSYSFPTAHAPPNSCAGQIFLLNCNFRI